MQPDLFGGGEPATHLDFSGARRLDLGQGAWVEYAPRCLAGHQALYHTLAETTRWRADRRWRYEREVDVPRLLASVPDECPGHPTLTAARTTLAARYDTDVKHVSLAWYRDGRDSVAWHSDRGGAAMPGALTISLSLGEPRRFLMRPKAPGTGRSLSFDLGWGDLLVMGGTCQQTWLHGVPKRRHAGPRMAVLFWCRPVTARAD